MVHPLVSRHVNPKVVLTCPTLDIKGIAAEIRARGNVPLAVADTALLELPMADLRETWASMQKLPAQKIAALSWHIAHDMVDDDEPAEHARDAAALFLLALRHHHASLPRALAGCRITWNDNATAQEVEYLT
jgi:hypothetical protein